MANDVSADARFSLRIRNLPAVLSTDAITSLLSHYGATRVRVLQRRDEASSGKEPGTTTSKKVQKAVASFATRDAQQNAQRRLHSLELAGQHLQVEVVGDPAATMSNEAKPEARETESNVPLKGQPPLPKGLPPPLPRTPAPVQTPLYAPAPLAPHLGLNYAPSPLLEYKYPKATESIVRNIANALIALPRFYTQVLHLMNKMNLPPPFEENAIPGRFSINQETARQDSESEDHRRKRKRRRIEETTNVQIVEEEEEEDDDNDAVSSKDSQTIQAHPQAPSPHSPSHKHQRSEAPAARNADTLGHGDNVSRPALIGKPLVRLPSVKKSAALSAAFQLGSDNGSYQEVHRSTRPGVISEKEVNRQRVSHEDLLKEPLMASYVRGSPSPNLLVRNVASNVDERDLRYVFGYVLPMDVALDSVKITIAPGNYSAVVTYPDEVTAAAAVNKLHGVKVEEKALLVSFQNFSPPGTTIDLSSVQRWSVEELARKRLTETQLASEKAMKKYQRGEPSTTLYVKNLAKTVELADLFAIFGAVLPHEMPLKTLTIRHFTEGRMKCQAFVTYPMADLTSSALLQVHGVVLKEKPLVVCFRKAHTS